jgi:hypothetical protein
MESVVKIEAVTQIHRAKREQGTGVTSMTFDRSSVTQVFVRMLSRRFALIPFC